MKILITQKEIDQLVWSVAEQIQSNWDITTDKVFICLLNGGYMFFSDLVKLLPDNIECDFMRVKSYHNKKQGDIQITKDLEIPIKGKDVYIVDDIFDTGNTVTAVIEYLNVKHPNSINIVTLITRDSSPLPTVASYHGKTISEEWLVGYGMDNSKGYMRNNPNIYAI
jgi:hypoxanthine phosphoribosyltransferase